MHLFHTAKTKVLITGAALSLLFFFINLLVINDYGFSWDFHYHHYAGRFHLGLPVPKITDPAPVPFSPPDPRLTLEDPFGPFTDIIPSLSHHLLYEKWHLLPQDSAYNFPMIVFGALGVGTLFFFLAESLGYYQAVTAAITLSLLPVYIGYSHNNMKDIPNAFAFALSLYFFWRLVNKKRFRDLIAASAVFAVAFNIKINSIVIPVVCGIWMILYLRKDFVSIIRGNVGTLFKNKYVFLYFIISPLFAVALWWPFWQHPLQKLLELPRFYSNNTINMPVLLTGNILHSGVNIPFYYPFLYLSVTIPPAVLLFATVGLGTCLLHWNKKNGIYSLVVVWLLIPLIRYFLPKSSAIDGVRHFLEVVYPLCALASIGFISIFQNILHRSKRLSWILITFIALHLCYINIHYHPYQTSYFNFLTGGIRGAWGKFDIDFWGTPQKEAITWLNTVAPKDSFVHIVMAQSSAAMYLRDDLRQIANQKDIWNSDYTVILNRESFFSVYPVRKYMDKKQSEGKLIYTRKIDGVPLVWIFKK